MKSITLDPESDRGMDKFRKAQQTVRSSKERFDRKSLDCLEKIDLLAAARCNLFSHALVAYQSALEVFAQKTYETFKMASKILEHEPHYAFTILKELTQAERVPKKEVGEDGKEKESAIPEMRENAIDHDQLLFFQDDYTDVEEPEKKNPESSEEAACPIAQLETESLISVGQETETPAQTQKMSHSSSILEAMDENTALLLEQGDGNLLDMDLSAPPPKDSATKSLLNDPLLDLLGDGPMAPIQPPSTGKSMLSALSNKFSALDNKLKSSTKEPTSGNEPTPAAANKSKNSKDMSSWFKLFSELDPLANPDAMLKQIDASNSHAT